MSSAARVGTMRVVWKCSTGSPARRRSSRRERDPLFEILDAVAADAELDEVESHGEEL